MSSDPPAQQPLGAKVWPCCPWSAALGSGACGQTRNSTPAPTPGPGPARQSAASLRLSRPAGPGRMSGCCGPPVAHWPGRQDNLQRVACEGSGHPEFPPPGTFPRPWVSGPPQWGLNEETESGAV